MNDRNSPRKINYQLVLDKTLAKIEKENELTHQPPRLLLHSCCGPCSSYVLEYLARYFRVTVLYYNPNIHPQEEYEKRLENQKKIIREMPFRYPVDLMPVRYDPETYFKVTKGMEEEREGGKRCRECFMLRMEEACKAAKEHGFDYFTTTLSVSRHKNAQVLNAIGKELEEKYDMKYLYADFKKRGGGDRSSLLAEAYGLYQQHYCGCVFSLHDEDH